MRTAIWKFDIFGPRSKSANPAASLVPMPRGAHILCVHEQGNRPFLWAAVDQNAEEVRRRILHQGTGNGSLEKPVEKYIGTVFLDGGGFVWHFFDLGEEDDPDLKPDPVEHEKGDDPGETFREIRDGPA